MKGPVSEYSILILIGAFVAGLLLGSLVFALVGKHWAKDAASRAVSAREPEISTLREQRDGFERQSVELKRQFAALNLEHKALEDRVHALGALSAERKAEVESLGRQLVDLQSRHDVTHRDHLVLTSLHASLKASAHEQAEAAREKLALLDQAEQRLA